MSFKLLYITKSSSLLSDLFRSQMSSLILHSLVCITYRYSIQFRLRQIMLLMQLLLLTYCIEHISVSYMYCTISDFTMMCSVNVSTYWIPHEMKFCVSPLLLKLSGI